MTVIDKGAGWFATSATAETLSRTTLGGWEAGTPVNLEQALKAGDPLGGHMVLGHVDGVARVAEVVPDGESLGLAIAAPDHLMRYIAAKGSVAVDGVSLTVNEIVEDRFAVTVIPHTRAVTTLGALEAGRAVNLEIDMVARYVARLLGKE
jgi:riboflavin synthase